MQFFEGNWNVYDRKNNIVRRHHDVIVSYITLTPANFNCLIGSMMSSIDFESVITTATSLADGRLAEDLNDFSKRCRNARPVFVPIQNVDCRLMLNT